ncbi:Phage Gifsy [Salmonella enterica subsp. enterica serovar Typhimurium]
MFDTAAAISWYAERDASIENEKLRKEVDDLRAAAESDLNPGTIDYERYRLTKAQADAQELKNAEREGLVLETELFTYILQRVAQEIAGILSGYRWYYSANILICASRTSMWSERKSPGRQAGPPR